MKWKLGGIAVIIIAAFILGVGLGQSYPQSPVSPPTVSNTNVTTNKIVVPDWIEVEQLNASWIKSPTVAGATYVIATQTSTNKEHANWICDGSADDVEIKAAIENLSVSVGYGGKLVLLEGVYNISNSIYPSLPALGITIEGVGNVTLKVSSGFPADYGVFHGMYMNLTIRNIKIDCNGIAEYGIFFNWENLVVDNCIIANAKFDGIRLDSSGPSGTINAIITKSRFDGCDEAGIYIDEGCKNIIITDNTFRNCFAGVQLYYVTSYEKIANNHFESCSRGVVAKGLHFIITGNTIEDCEEGIYVVESSKVIISNNIMDTCKPPSFFHGIYLGLVDDSIISSNIISDAKYGIYVHRGENNSICGNIIKDSIDSGIWVGGTGAGLYSAKRHSVEMNTIRNSGNYGINLTEYAVNIICRNNDVYNGGGVANIRDVGGPNIIQFNRGFTTENSGTAIISAGSTSVIVNHGLDREPTSADITVTPITDLAGASYYWFDLVNATSFTIHVDASPTSDVAFAWRAETSS
ncbi:MAG: hypothetical protein DRN95_04560 [Candidatus Hydrothermarchaeota archaeon]|nr:MAG: hypothetical protein DRN95_04560 [Candidatus Hydrothermarchaeota archaeon]